MAAFKVMFLLAVAVACTYAQESERVKKAVVVGAYPYGVHSYGHDDGQYYPGKYEKPTFYNAPVAPVAPAAYSAYSAYPYSYGAYPYGGAYGGAYGGLAARHIVY